AIISDGEQQAGVKFRFEPDSALTQTASAVPLTSKGGASGEMQMAPELAYRSMQNTPQNLLNTQPLGSPPPATAMGVPLQRIYPGIPRVHTEGARGGEPSRARKFTLKRTLPDSSSTQSSP